MGVLLALFKAKLFLKQAFQNALKNQNVIFTIFDIIFFKSADKVRIIVVFASLQFEFECLVINRVRELTCKLGQIF